MIKPEYLDKLNQWGIQADAAWPDRQHLEPHQKTVEMVIAAFAKAAINKETSSSEFRELAEICLELILDTPAVINHLSRLRTYNEYTFLHSLNVAVISGLIGRELGLSGMAFKNLVLSGLLHDIGKQLIPQAIINKPGALTVREMAIIKEHARHGYELLKELAHIPYETKIGVLQHHERLDGSGYPFGLTKYKISLFARIIAVADSYDAMTSERVYRAKMSPFTAMEAIADNMPHKLDPNICMLFLAKLKEYFTGSPIIKGPAAVIVLPGQRLK